MQIILSKDIYSKEAILKASYVYHDKFLIEITTDINNFILDISPSFGDVFNKNEFLSNLQEQQLREDLNGQFGELRDAIYKKAFCLVE